MKALATDFILAVVAGLTVVALGGSWTGAARGVVIICAVRWAVRAYRGRRA